MNNLYCEVYNNNLYDIDLLLSFNVRYYYHYFIWLTFLFEADFINCLWVQL